MPVTFEQFECQFDKLQAAFGVTKSSKNIDKWYQEFEDCEYGPFVKAMHSCQYDERFPTWGKFRAEYRNCLGPELKSVDKPECKYCTGGKVFYRGFIQRSNDVHDLMGNCAVCCAGKLGGRLDVDPRTLIKDSLGILRTRRAVEHDRKQGAMNNQPQRKPVNGLEVVQTTFGKDEEGKEEDRRKSLYVEKKRENEGAQF
jgi:hypothetical protein